MSGTKVDERIAARRREVRDDVRRRRLRRTVVVAVILAVVAVAVAIERSSLVALDEIRVTGTQRLTPDTVRDASGLVLGTSTLRLDLSDAQAAVEALPLVASADARRLDPLTVLIAVTERVPVAIAEAGDARVLVDGDGVVIDAWDGAGHDGAEPGVVEIRLPRDASLPDPGERVAALPALGNAHATMVGLSGPLRARVVEYRACGADELVLVLDHGTRVRFGRAERIDEKVRALGAVLEDIGDTEVAVIDVRAPSAPVVER